MALWSGGRSAIEPDVLQASLSERLGSLDDLLPRLAKGECEAGECGADK